MKIMRLMKIRLRATSMAGLKKRLFPWTKARPLPRGDQTAVWINISSIYISTIQLHTRIPNSFPSYSYSS